jgi:hypothetical protein
MLVVTPQCFTDVASICRGSPVILPIKALLCISFALIRLGLRVECRLGVLFTGPALLGVIVGVYTYASYIVGCWVWRCGYLWVQNS